MNRIGNNIRYLRSLKNVNQIELGKATGIKQSKISRIETGGTPDHHEAVVIANYFMVTAEMLSNEDLTERFKTEKDWQEWSEKEERAREIAEKQHEKMVLAPIWLDVLINHYISAMSRILNVEQSQIRQELENDFLKTAQTYHHDLKGSSYDERSEGQ